MVPEILEDVLEKEMEEALEIKNREALHRYVKHLVSSFSSRNDILDIRSDVKVIAETMKKGFEFVEKRFEDINKRFEDVNKRFDDVNRRFDDMNKRFDDMNKRFDDMVKMFKTLGWLIGLGFVVMNAVIIILKFIG
ncbi:MAG: hypothetical protein ACP5QT_02870 [Brevinematia bacterium]